MTTKQAKQATRGKAARAAAGDARSVQACERELQRLAGKRPALVEQQAAKARRVEELEAQLGDLHYRASVEDDAAARTQAVDVADALGRAEHDARALSLAVARLDAEMVRVSGERDAAVRDEQARIVEAQAQAAQAVAGKLDAALDAITPLLAEFHEHMAGLHVGGSAHLAEPLAAWVTRTLASFDPATLRGAAAAGLRQMQTDWHHPRSFADFVARATVRALQGDAA